MIDNKRTHLERLINAFEHGADSFLLHQSSMEDIPISSIGDYDVFDNADIAFDFMEDSEDARPFNDHSGRASDGSGMDTLNPENLPILLPSSLGWKWCTSHDAKALAAKEAQLRYAQANDSIHQICLAIGFKSAIFRTQVQPAKTQQTKTRAWKAIHNVDATVQEHARIYSMARDAYYKLQSKSSTEVKLPPLCREDLNAETLILGSDVTGQCNKQPSWIWGFGKTTEDDGTWMDDCKLLFRQCCMHVVIHT